MDTYPLSAAELRELLAQMVGTTAWGSRTKSGAGSTFALQFGPALLDNARHGEFQLVVYCAWRITDGSQIVLSWHDDTDKVLAPGLVELEGVIVSSIDISEWNDLTIHFKTGRELQIINDFSPFKDFDSTWYLLYRRQKTYYVVNPASSFIAK